MTTLRARILAEAQAAVGLSAAPDKLAAFERLMGEGENPGVARDMATYAGSSTCGLVVRGIWRRAGVDDPSVRPPYHLGSAISAALDLAHRVGAWVEPSIEPGARGPSPGDMVFVGDGVHGHVYTVETVDSLGHVSASIDGGQVDPAGRQLVARKLRTWAWHGGKLFDSSQFATRGLGFENPSERVVNGWIDVSKLPERPDLRVTPQEGAITRSTPPAPMAAVSIVEGIDLSRWQPQVDYAAVERAGVGFVLVKLGEGSSAIPPYADPLAATHCAGVRSTSMVLGGYHFIRVRHELAQDGARQAEDFFAAWERERCVLAELDAESEENEHATPQEWADSVGGFVARWRALAGPTPILLYSYETLLASPTFAQVRALPGIDALPVSVAKYAAQAPRVPAPWGDWALWQYAADAGVIGHVDGVPGHVDRYRYRGTLDGLQRLGRAL